MKPFLNEHVQDIHEHVLCCFGELCCETFVDHSSMMAHASKQHTAEVHRAAVYCGLLVAFGTQTGNDKPDNQKQKPPQ